MLDCCLQRSGSVYCLKKADIKRTVLAIKHTIRTSCAPFPRIIIRDPAPHLSHSTILLKKSIPLENPK